MKAGIPILLALAMLCSCSRPASYEEFIRCDEASGGIYEFSVDLPDSTASYDLSFYTSALKAPLQLEISLDSLRETVWFPEEKGLALYRSLIRPGASMALRIKPLDPPDGFRGLGIILEQNDGTR